MVPQSEMIVVEQSLHNQTISNFFAGMLKRWVNFISLWLKITNDQFLKFGLLNLEVNIFKKFSINLFFKGQYTFLKNKKKKNRTVVPFTLKAIFNFFLWYV